MIPAGLRMTSGNSLRIIDPWEFFRYNVNLCQRLRASRLSRVLQRRHMADYKPIHDWMVSYMRQRLSREYQDVKCNTGSEKKNEFHGHYPDLILGNHGMVLALVEVETEASINEAKADEWKTLTGHGVKVIVMAPGSLKAKVVDLLFQKGIVDKVSVGSYDITIRMP